MHTIRSKSPKETDRIAAGFFKKLFGFGFRHATTVALEGELGTGKTVFVRGVARALGIKNKIKSPTFVLIKKYRIPVTFGSQFSIVKYLYHIDCYRLRDEKDIEILGIKEILSNPENIVMIEWSERVEKILPRKHIKVHIDHISKNKRRIKIKYL